jgi:hypothetical protein
MAKAFSSSKHDQYYDVKLHIFVKEWSVKSGQYPVFRGGQFCETSFAKKC